MPISVKFSSVKRIQLYILSYSKISQEEETHYFFFHIDEPRIVYRKVKTL